MSNEKQRQSRRRRRIFLSGLAHIVRPPFTTPQWKDAIREDESRAKKQDRGPDAASQIGGGA